MAIEGQEVGDEFSARQLCSLRELYTQQSRAVASIVGAVYRIAANSFANAPARFVPDRELRRHAFESDDASNFWRPHHSFVIDGRRGTGKTTALLTLARYLKVMRFGPPSSEVFLAEDKGIIDELGFLDLEPRVNAAGRRVALTLPIVFTEDMEEVESTMEAVFALLEKELDKVLERNPAPPLGESVERLKARLHDEIGVAWTYSRRIGIEALSQDSLGYNDFVDRRLTLNAKTYTKVVLWRRFIDDLLDALGYQTLVLLFDDSDLNAEVAEDIVRSVRMYFNHPRTVSVLAVDFATLSNTIINRNVSRCEIMRFDSFTEAMDRLERRKARTLEIEEANSVALLDKVLPRPNRYRLSIGDMNHVDHFFHDGVDSDVSGSFVEACRTAFYRSRDEGLPDMGWWLLAGPYKRLFASDIRGIISFRRRTREGSPPLDALLSNRDFTRLASAIESDLGLLSNLVSSGDLDGVDDPLEPAELQFVDLWMDAKIAAGALTHNTAFAGVRRLSDQAHLASERTVPDDRGFGLSSALVSELLPRNCIYFHQLRRVQLMLEDSLPEASSIARGFSALASPGRRRKHVGEALEELKAELSPGGQVRSDDELVDFARTRIAALIRNDDVGDLDDDEIDFDSPLIEGAAMVTVLVAAVSRSGRSGLKALVSWLDGPDSEADVHRLASRLAKEWPVAERQRLEATFLWNCANDLAVLGDNDVGILPRQKRREELTSRRGKSRLLALVRDSVEAATSAPDRHALLLAWSICPLIRPLYDFGADHLVERGAARDAWSELVNVFERASGANIWGEVRDWALADMSDATLSRITSDIAATRGMLEDLNGADAAGMVPIEAFWTHPADHRVAALLGVSKSWAASLLGP